jgi:hypothetical protein
MVLMAGLLAGSVIRGCKKWDGSDMHSFPVLLYDSLHLDYGQCYVYCNPKLTLCFDSVLSDGRCPVGLECIWEGNAEVRFRMELEHLHSFTLNTHGSFRTDTILEGFRIQLVDLLPYPVYQVEVPPEDYRASVVISVEK